MDYKEQLLSVYPNCKANVGHSRVTIVEIYYTVRNDAELKRRTEAYRQALEAKEAGKVLKTMKAENFPMFVPAVLCKGGRNKESIESWTCFCQADFDNVDPELLDVYFDVPRTDPDNPETRLVLFLTPSEILAKLTMWGNIKKPISVRQLNTLMDKKGFARVRHGEKRQRGYLVVELEAATINSNRIVTTAAQIF